MDYISYLIVDQEQCMPIGSLQIRGLYFRYQYQVPTFIWFLFYFELKSYVLGYKNCLTSFIRHFIVPSRFPAKRALSLSLYIYIK